MSELPRFKRGSFLGVDIPRVDYADLRQREVGASSAAKNIGVMTEFLQKKVEAQNIKKVEQEQLAAKEFASMYQQRDVTREMRKAQDPDSYLEGITSKVQSGQTLTEAEVLAKQQATNFATATLTADYMAQVNELNQEAEKNKLTPEAYKLELEAIGAGYISAAEEQLGVENVFAFRTKVLEHGLNDMNRYNTNYTKSVTLPEIERSVKNSLNQYELSVLQNSNVLDKPSYITFATQLGYTPEQAEGMYFNFVPKHEEEIIRSEVARLREVNPGAIPQYLESVKVTGMTPSQKRQLDGILLRDYETHLLKQREIFEETRENDISQALTFGVDVAPLDEDEIRNLYPEKQDEMIARHKITTDMTNETLAITENTNEGIAETIDKFNQDLLARSTSDPNYKHYASFVASYTKNASKIMELRATDPAAEVLQADRFLAEQERGAVQNAFSADYLPLMTYLSAMDEQQTNRGVKQQYRRYFTNSRAQYLVNEIHKQVDAEDNSSLVGMMQNIVRNTGMYGDEISQQLAENGLKPEIALALRYADDELETATRLVNVSNENADDLKKQLGERSSDVDKLVSRKMQDFNSALTHGATSASKQQALTMMEVVKKLTLSSMVEDSGLSLGQAIDLAYKSIVPEAVILTNHVVGVVTNDIDVTVRDNLPAIVRNRENFDLFYEGKNVEIPPEIMSQSLDEKIAKETYLQKLQEDFTWIRNETGDGWVLQTGIGNDLVLDKDGDIVIVYDDEVTSNTYTPRGGASEFRGQLQEVQEFRENRELTKRFLFETDEGYKARMAKLGFDEAELKELGIVVNLGR